MNPHWKVLCFDSRRQKTFFFFSFPSTTSNWQLCCEICGIIAVISFTTVWWLLPPALLIVFTSLGLQVVFSKASEMLQYACVQGEFIVICLLQFFYFHKQWRWQRYGFNAKLCYMFLMIKWLFLLFFVISLSIARSSITSHINATSYGLSTIHSTRSEEIFMNEFCHRQYLFTSTRNLLLESARKIDFLQQFLCWTFLSVLLFSSNFITGLAKCNNERLEFKLIPT